MSDQERSAALALSESIAQLVTRFLVENGGMGVKVTIGDKTYDGYVINMDISPHMGPAKGDDYLYATVHVPVLDTEEVDGSTTKCHMYIVKVSIHVDGTVNVMPDPPQES